MSLAGIRTVMHTGDQLNTGLAIARELGLGKKEPTALHARDLIDAEPDRLAELAHNTDVFARVSPEEKWRIVEALQQAGEVVAVTGDGVNDAPALKLFAAADYWRWDRGSGKVSVSLETKRAVMETVE